MTVAGRWYWDVGKVTYAMPDGGSAAMIRRAVRQVTSKRQVTIPKEMAEAVGIADSIELYLAEDNKTIIIKPLDTKNWSIAEDIIRDLAAEGVAAEDMAAAFSKRRSEIESVVERLNSEIDAELDKNPNSGREFLESLNKGR